MRELNPPEGHCGHADHSYDPYAERFTCCGARNCQCSCSPLNCPKDPACKFTDMCRTERECLQERQIRMLHEHNKTGS